MPEFSILGNNENPCCYCKLRTGVQLIAIFNIVHGFISIVLKSFWLATSISLIDDQSTVPLLTLYEILTLILLVSNLIQMCFGVILFFSARKKELKKCQAWIITTCILLIIYFFKSVSDFVFVVHRYRPLSSLTSFYQMGFAIAFELYQILIVWLFVKELKKEKNRLSGTIFFSSTPSPTTIPNLLRKSSSQGLGGSTSTVSGKATQCFPKCWLKFFVSDSYGYTDNSESIQA